MSIKSKALMKRIVFGLMALSFIVVAVLMIVL